MGLMRPEPQVCPNTDQLASYCINKKTTVPQTVGLQEIIFMYKAWNFRAVRDFTDPAHFILEIRKPGVLKKLANLPEVKGPG